jgi:hypothetical protein
LDYSGDRFGLLLQHLAIGPEFDAQMGFVTRQDIRRSDTYGRITFRPAVLGLRRVELWAGGQYIVGWDRQLLDWNAGPFLDLQWESGDGIGAFYANGEATVDEEFDLADRIPVPVGRYDVEFSALEFHASRKRPLWGGCGAQLQRNFGGRVETYECTAGVSAGSRFSLEVGYGRNEAALPNGSIAGALVSARLGLFFSKRLTATALVQWNELDKKVLTNLRLNFIHRAGSDLFVVVNDERGSEVEPWKVRSRGAVLKLTYLVRF